MRHLIRQVIFSPPISPDGGVHVWKRHEVIYPVTHQGVVQAGSFSVIVLATFESAMNINFVADRLHSSSGFPVVLLCPRKRKKFLPTAVYHISWS